MTGLIIRLYTLNEARTSRKIARKCSEYILNILLKEIHIYYHERETIDSQENVMGKRSVLPLIYTCLRI